MEPGRKSPKLRNCSKIWERSVSKVARASCIGPPFCVLHCTKKGNSTATTLKSRTRKKLIYCLTYASYVKIICRFCAPSMSTLGSYAHIHTGETIVVCGCG